MPSCTPGPRIIASKGYAGPLSLKTVLSGRVAWIVRGRELIVDRSSFLILSAGETYSMDVTAMKPVETCCAFFAPGYVERVALNMTTPLDNGLDSPDRLAPESPYLSALHRDRERALASRVQTLAGRCRAGLAPGAFEEDCLVTATELLLFYRQCAAKFRKIGQECEPGFRLTRRMKPCCRRCDHRAEPSAGARSRRRHRQRDGA